MLRSGEGGEGVIRVLSSRTNQENPQTYLDDDVDGVVTDMVALLISLIIGALLDRFRLTIGQSTSMIDGAARGSPKRFETTWCSVHVVEAHRRYPESIRQRLRPRLPARLPTVVGAHARVSRSRRDAIPRVTPYVVFVGYRCRRGHRSILSTRIKEYCRVLLQGFPEALIFRMTTRLSSSCANLANKLKRKSKGLGNGLRIKSGGESRQVSSLLLLLSIL